ncbi:MAG: C39 family peptidase [Planctomycetaceae bacterium]
MTRKLLMLCAALFCAALPSLAVEAAGIPSSEMNYSAATQAESQWCWAACIQMVLKRHGVEMDQSTIVERTYGRDPFGRLPDWPASFEVITRNLNGWGFDQLGRRYTLSSRFGRGAPPAAMLVAEMKARRPVILAYQSGPTSGHAVVCTGVTYTETAGGVMIHSIVVRDPSPISAAAGARGRVEYDAAAMARLITGYWTVSVQLGEESAAPERATADKPCDCPRCRDAAKAEARAEREPAVEEEYAEERYERDGSEWDADSDSDAVAWPAECATCSGNAFVRCPAGPCAACGWSNSVLCPRCFPAPRICIANPGQAQLRGL